MEKYSPVVARAMLGFFAAIIIGMFTSVYWFNEHKLETIKNNKVIVLGKISSTACSDHGRINYSYYVNEKEFNGSGYSCISTSCESTKLGTPLTVSYSSIKPQWSSCNNEEVLNSSQKNAYFLFIIILSIAMVVIFHITKPGFKIK